ncbi:MAG: T9SS type A sorting domain-containing protein [Bacteroidia bacterium]
MKKFLLSVFVLFSVILTARSQAIILQEDFDTYDGLVSSIPAGFVITFNDTSTCSSCIKSFYSSAGFCGVTCNSYKFGQDSATIITPTLTSNPGSVSFYMKGNGNPSSLNPFHFKVYESPDSIVWNLVHSYDSIVSTSQVVTLPLNPSTNNLKFFYEKDTLGYNVGFDDLVVYGPTGVNENRGLQAISIFPSPTSGIINVGFNSHQYNDVEIKVINILGKEVKIFDLKNSSTKFILNIADQPEGIYLLRIKSGADEIVKRVILKK